MPPGRDTALARFVTIAKAQAVARVPLERCTATPLAFGLTLEAATQDDVLNPFDIVVATPLTDAAKVGKTAGLGQVRSSCSCRTRHSHQTSPWPHRMLAG